MKGFITRHHKQEYMPSFIQNFSTYIRAILFTLYCSLIFLAPLHAQDDAAIYEQGKTIFVGKCTSCHQVHEKVIGPALAGVYDKYERDWLYAWIKNSQALVKAGDEQAVAIFEEYNKSVMTSFALSNEEIDATLEYIRVETEKGPPVKAVAAGGAAEDEGFGLTGVFFAVTIVILLFILFMLSRITGTLGDLVREKMGQLVPAPTSFKRKYLNKKMMAALSLAALIFLGYATVDSAQNLGRQQNYAPTQPIKFSHQLHAGTHQIECQYCHSGAAKGKSAIIPSANVCMNCHKAVKEGPKYGKEEIAKIYAAVGWDPDNLKYIEGYEQQPIEWIRIHNLPDHVYFNHAQHVNAGGLECQQCHGAVEEMEVVRQHSTLGMGWCINCHRETEVNFEGNDYYKVYEKYHDQLKSGEIKQVTVEDIGGLECQKCHY